MQINQLQKITQLIVNVPKLNETFQMPSLLQWKDDATGTVLCPITWMSHQFIAGLVPTYPHVTFFSPSYDIALKTQNHSSPFSASAVLLKNPLLLISQKVCPHFQRHFFPFLFLISSQHCLNILRQ